MANRPNLLTDSVVMRPYSLELQHSVAAAADAWRQFIALPDAEKHLYDAADTQSSIGYEQKLSGERGSNDHKENFDYAAGSYDEFADTTHSAVTQVFLGAAANLAALLRDEITAFGAEIEKEAGIEGMASLAARSRDNYFLRFLHYPPSPAGAVIGEAHTDHSGFTFHLYESTDGCRALSPGSRKWHPLPVSDSEMVAFAGMQLQLASHGRIKALCHDIRANQVASQQGRIAIVCFTALADVARYDRNTHGRLQEKTPGFNYDMSHSEFTKLFTSK